MEFTLEDLYTKKEGQTYDHKSARKDPKGLSNHIVAFANADVGTLVIGIEDDFTVTGIDGYHNNVNDILRVPFDYCTPSVHVTTKTVECTDKNGNPNHLLVMTIPQSSELTRTSLFIVPLWRILIGILSLNTARKLDTKNPQRFFKRARVRFIRYDGIEAKVGTEMNVIKDEIFEGRILDIVRRSLDFVRSQIKEHTKLGTDGLFHTTPEYPEFAWKEIIINSIAHRDYSIKGTDIQIKMFDDRITVESPGILPGIVRLNNLRTVHFSRNPNIARFLHEYDYVQEFGEGIDRMFNEMAAAGLPAPEYHDNAFMLNATIRNGVISEADEVINEVINGAINISVTEQAVLAALKKKARITKVELQKETSLGKSTIDRTIKALKEKGLIERVGSNKTGYWKIINKGL